MKLIHLEERGFTTLTESGIALVLGHASMQPDEVALFAAPETYPRYPFQVVAAARFHDWVPLTTGNWALRPKAWWILRDPFAMGEVAVSGRTYHGGERVVDVHEADEMAIRARGISWTGPLQNPGPPREVLRTWEEHQVAQLFHRLWGKAKDGEPYDKSEWARLLEMLRERGVKV